MGGLKSYSYKKKKWGLKKTVLEKNYCASEKIVMSK